MSSNPTGTKRKPATVLWCVENNLPTLRDEFALVESPSINEVLIYEEPAVQVGPTLKSKLIQELPTANGDEIINLEVEKSLFQLGLPFFLSLIAKAGNQP